MEYIDSAFQSSSQPPFLSFSFLQQEAVKQSDDYVKQMHVALTRIEKLADSLMKKGRKEATDNYQRLNLNDLIAIEVTFLEADIEFKHKVIKEFKLDPNLPEFFGNYADFSQICSNMIENAVDATRQSPIRKIDICTRHDARNICIDSKDTGHGISSQLMEHIFEPFFSTKALKGDETGEEPIGTGLGLYSCQQLIENYNGTITVDSEPLEGTTFTLSLPYTERLVRFLPEEPKRI